jgi:hypothetical protein
MKISMARVRDGFLILFIIATLITFANVYQVSSHMQSASIDDPDKVQISISKLDNSIFVLTTSIITSLTTLVGFTITTILNIRKERRETREAALTLQQKEIDLQRALIELEELKKKVSQ